MKAPLIVTLLLAAAGVAAQDAPRGEALLAEARSALGGDERLRAVKTLQARGDFKRIAGQAIIEGELELLIDAAGRLRRDEDLSLPGGGPAIVRTEVLDGTEVWDENTGGTGPLIFRRGARGDGGARAGGNTPERGRAAIDPERLKQLQLRTRQAELARFLLAMLLTANGTVSWVGTAESPDGKADVLEIVPAEGPPTRLYLDVATHMPLMLTWQGAAPRFAIGRRGRAGAPDDQAAASQPPGPGGETTLRMTLAEYKTVNGIKLPHFITRAAGNQTIEEWTVSNYRVNPSFRADAFRKR